MWRCRWVIEIIEDVIGECDLYERFGNESMLKADGIIGRNEWQIRVMN